MHGNITPIKPEPPPVVKERTITLTNRPPMKIVEDEWPIISQGVACYKVSGAPYEWEIAIRVRGRKTEYGKPSWYIVHASYSTWDDDVQPDDDSDKDNQRVRVGHYFFQRHDSNDLTKHIVEVGEELKARILNKNMLVYVVFAVDRCFANLPVEGI